MHRGGGAARDGRGAASRFVISGPFQYFFFFLMKQGLYVSNLHIPPLGPRKWSVWASSPTCCPPVKMRSPPVYLSIAGRLLELLSPSPAGALCVASGGGWHSRRGVASTHWEQSPAPGKPDRSQTRFSQLALTLNYFIPVKKGSLFNGPIDVMGSLCFGGMLLIDKFT